MARVIDILRKSPQERLELYRAHGIEKVIIDGNEFGGKNAKGELIDGYGTFSFLWEKSYIKEPVRSSDGSIGNLNSYSTFLTPHLRINFSLMSIDTYRTLMQLIYSRNEHTVTCYDVVNGGTTTNKMYFTTEEMPKLWTMVEALNGDENAVELLGVQDYTVEMVGTNADVDLLSVHYYYNENNDKLDKTIREAEDDVYSGEEIIVGINSAYPNNPPLNKAFSHWEDINGTKYDNGSITTVYNNLELFAMWKDSTIKKLSFNYGIAETDTTIDPTTGIITPIYDKDVQQGISIGTLPKIISPYVEDKKAEKRYYPYENGGWYRLPVKDESVRVYDNDLYWSDRNTIIYCLFDKKNYTVNYITNSDYTIPTQSVKYAEAVYQPTLAREGYTFQGWFVDSAFETRFTGTMPPYSITLYAKWEKSE